jgi:hypothetical protein
MSKGAGRRFQGRHLDVMRGKPVGQKAQAASDFQHPRARPKVLDQKGRVRLGFVRECVDYALASVDRIPCVRSDVGHRLGVPHRREPPSKICIQFEQGRFDGHGAISVPRRP